MTRNIFSAAWAFSVAFFAISLTSISAYAASQAKTIEVSTPNTSLILKAEVGGELRICYYGTRISASELDGAAFAEHAAYPVYGLDCVREPALAVTFPDGNMSSELEVTEISSVTEEYAEVTRVRMKDKVYPFHVTICYRACKDCDIIETWAEYENRCKKPVILREFASAYLPVRCGDVYVSHLHGSWANEGYVVTEPLERGVNIIKNKDGLRNSQTEHPEVMISLDGKPQENSGSVIGAALCYSGNYELKFDTYDSDYHDFFAGINPDASSYRLASGESFVTPELALTYSEEGLSGVSRSFHRWARAHKLCHGDRLRKILLNSWEGVYFDVNESGMDQMMGDIASMGGELFVMDDGWFGGKYPRKNDSYALGDWTADTAKLPGGLPSLVRMAKKHGISFGLWIEPEMTNTLSELYEKHPDWVLKAPMRDVVTGRGGTQMVLDLANPRVRDFVVGVVDDIITENPEIDYIKWDANMPVRNHGSQYLKPDEQSHLYIEYHRGLAQVCKRIREKYPDLTIQACASGGGRVNYGLLPWFDEFWVSDNTDALQRVYMQWGTSYFFPAIAMASHISAAPNHQTGRVIPIKYRIDVAMSGRLGMEIQPKNMTEEEIAQCRKAIAEYKEIRPVVQFGDIFRLVSPYDGKGVASLMYCSPQKDKAVFYWWKTETFCDRHLPRIKMAGLDPERSYVIRELNRVDAEPLSCEGKSFSGKFLMSNGLELPFSSWAQKDWASRVLYLVAEP